jgi:hypothetical protein
MLRGASTRARRSDPSRTGFGWDCRPRRG